MNTPDFGDIQDFILQFHLQLFNFRDVKFVIARGLVELVLIKFFFGSIRGSKLSYFL